MSLAGPIVGPMRIQATFRFGPLDGHKLTLPEDALQVIDLSQLEPVRYVRGRVDEKNTRHYYSPAGLDAMVTKKAAGRPSLRLEPKVSHRSPWRMRSRVGWR